MYALQAYQTETRLSAEAYEQRKLYLDAAVEYALRKNLRKAVRLFEQEQEWVKAAAIWNCIGNERQAARCYERGGKLESAYAIHQRLNDVVSAVKLAIRLGRHGEAASFSLQLGQSGKAAEQFALSGDLSQAAKLYKEIKDWANALRIYKKLGDRMQQAEMLIELERMSEAAILLEGEDKPTRAAQVYEAAGEVHKAALLYSQLQEWQKARDLFETLGEWERAAEVCVHLDDDRQTADAYKKAAEAAENSHPLDLEHIASLWESAADSYQQAAARRREAACRHKVSQYKKLPYISLQISTDKRFFVGESDALPVILVNAGGGPAYDIVIQSTTKVGKVESGESKLQGLEAGCSEQLTLPILSETPGRVRLNFQVSFSDAQQHDYTIKEHAYIEVKGKKSQRYAHLDFSIGLERLNQLVAEKQHQVRKDHATLEARLLANLTDENKSGSTETTRVERTRIMDALNDFVLEYFGITFTSLCQGE